MAKPTNPDRRKAYRRGLTAEFLAMLWLRLKGYRILARRYKTGRGEIDIIAGRGRIIAFVEVKARRTIDEALLAVTAGNRRRVFDASRIWMAGHPQRADCVFRYDILAITPWRRPHHLANAFAEGGFY